MKKTLALLAVLLLLGCVPEYQEAEKVPVKAEIVPKELVNAMKERVIPPPYTKVWQTRGKEKILWGYDKEGRLVLLNSSSKTVVLDYNDGLLTRIDDGVKPINFIYDANGKLVSAEKGIKKWVFTYTSTGKLWTMENDEKLTVYHDSKGRLSSVSRDGGASTEFSYDKYNRTYYMLKGGIGTDFYYDSDGRLKLIKRQDDNLVLAYWRYDLLSSLSGTMYGLKETVNYGPTAITLVSNVEQNEFTSQYPEDAEARLKAFNTFLFCKRFRKLPVLFDGQSWVLYHEYMKGDISDYLLTSFVCDYLP
ncbi:MAG: hypothetical protein QXT19_02390 [Candidatus Woesearchaeota archaeon]